TNVDLHAGPAIRDDEEPCLAEAADAEDTAGHAVLGPLGFERFGLERSIPFDQAADVDGPPEIVRIGGYAQCHEFGQLCPPLCGLFPFVRHRSHHSVVGSSAGAAASDSRRTASSTPLTKRT